MTVLIYIIPFLAVLSVVVLVHESGHFFAARLFRVKVEEFAFGFGREIVGRTAKKSGTRYKLCVFPLGGYVRMLGDSDAASSGRIEVAPDDERFSFPAQRLWKRFVIIFAGPFMNYAFAVLALAFVYSAVGTYTNPPVVGSVVAGSPAETAGLKTGDRIVEVNGVRISEFGELKTAVVLTYKTDITLEVERGGERMTFVFIPEVVDGTPMIGVTNTPSLKIADGRMPPHRAVARAVSDVWTVTKGTMIYLKQIVVNGRSGKDMRGPLGIAEMSGDAAKNGLFSLALFIVQVSIAVGLINLMPIPMMDGGHLFLYVIEAIRRKALPEKAQEMIMKTGFLLIIMLFAYTMWNDIPRIWERLWS